MDDELKTMLKQLLNNVEQMMSGQAKLEAGQAELRAGQDKLWAGLDQLRHTTAANHFTLVGRIDQLSSMLAEHMSGHSHGSPPPVGLRKLG